VVPGPLRQFPVSIYVLLLGFLSPFLSLCVSLYVFDCLTVHTHTHTHTHTHFSYLLSSPFLLISFYLISSFSLLLRKSQITFKKLAAPVYSIVITMIRNVGVILHCVVQ
jgi:uncharacterized membrane protein